MSQADAVKLSIGDTARVKSIEVSTETWIGRITHIQSTQTSGFFKVEIAIDDTANAAMTRPGQLYDVVITLDDEQRAYLVPPELIQFDKERDDAPFLTVATAVDHRLDVEVIRVDESGAYVTSDAVQGPIEILLCDF